MKHFLQKSWVVLVLLLALFSNGVFAQNNKIINDSLFSSVLKENRSLRIILPDDYQAGSSKKYETIYVLDGEWNLDLFSYAYNFQKKEGFVPPAIIVALPNSYPDGQNMRERDFLPVKSEYNKLAGGADNFIGFLKAELIPYINSKYPSNNENSLFGHSFGGLFTMYAFLVQPDLFSNYYCSDPSFWWGNDFDNKLAEKTFKTTKYQNKTLWVNGITETAQNMGILKMDSILKSSAPSGLSWKIGIYPKETHNSVRFKGIYDGLRFTYDGFSDKDILFHPMAGIVKKDLPFYIFLNNTPNSLYYTNDGTEPTEKSAKADRTILMKGPGKLYIKSLAGSGKYASKGYYEFKESDFLPAIANLKKAKNGLKYTYFEGKWDTVPDFSKLKPITDGIADSTFKLNTLKSTTNFGCVFEGYIKIDVEGQYSFALKSDDGAKLYFSNQLIANNDGLHSMENIKTYTLPLKKGYYPLRIEYFQQGGDMGVDIYYVLPGSQNPTKVPASAFYHVK
jgi:predicted alpha/beta superfamily hydrolase